MILDTTHTGTDVVVSYWDERGALKIKKYPLSEKEQYSWEVTTEKDPQKDPTFRNWNGKPIRKKPSKRFNQWRMFEFLHNLPDSEKKILFSSSLPRMQSFDIEVEIVDGFPSADLAKEKVTLIAISWYEQRKTVVMGWQVLSAIQQESIKIQFKERLKDFGDWTFTYLNYSNEVAMLTDFVYKFIPRFDFLIGWYVMDYDWPYLKKRCENLGIKINAGLKWDKGYSPTPNHFPIFDYLEYYTIWDKTIQMKESNTLDWVSDKVLGIKKVQYTGTLQDLYERDYDKYTLYCAIDSVLPLLIHNKLKTISPLFFLSLYAEIDLRSATGSVRTTHGLLFKAFWNRNLVVADPETKHEKTRFEGAWVKQPEPGLYETVACYDYASLYPTTMRQINVSPETFVCRVQGEELEAYKNNPNFIVTASGSIFKKEPGVLSVVMENLYNDRKKFKSVWKLIDQKFSKKH